MEEVVEPMVSPVTVPLDVLDAMPRDSALSEDEEAFLDAVKHGELAKVRDYVKEKHVDVNCIDLFGQSALQIAAVNGSTAIANLLLDSGADVRAALLQAVARDSVETVRSLLKYYGDDGGTLMRCKSSIPQVGHYTSPLMLAAQNDSYEIVKLLLENKHTIPDNDCIKKSVKDLGHRNQMAETAVLQLHRYQAWASPSFLSLSYLMDNSTSNALDLTKTKDPLVRAFLLNREVVELAESEYEFGCDYKELSKRTECYAMSLLDMCRSMEEIKLLMHVPGLEKDRVAVRGTSSRKERLSVLDFAIKNKNEKFVVHSYSQLLLNSELYPNYEQWKKYNPVVKTVIGLLFTLLLPMWFPVYILAPHSTLGKALATPLVKFMSHMGAFSWFLFLLVSSSLTQKRDICKPNCLDILLRVWMVGMIFQEMKEAYRQGIKRYLSQYWNIVSLLMVVFFAAVGILWIAGCVLVNEKACEKGYRVILVANGFFAIAIVASFIQGTNFFQVNSVLGPLQLSLVNMMRDIVKFLFLFSLVFLAFACAEQLVYSTYVGMHPPNASGEASGNAFLKTSCRASGHASSNAFGNAFWDASWKSFCHVSGNASGIASGNASGNASDHALATLSGAMRFLFWDLFGMAELKQLETGETPKLTQYSGEVILGLYNATAIVIFLNMLIAMMSNTFQRVADDPDIQWKFSRARMWMQYMDDGNVLPPPFNLIPTPHGVARLFRRCLASCCPDSCTGMQGNNEESSAIENEVMLKRPKVIKHLIQRYRFKIEKERREAKSETNELKSLILKLSQAVDKLQTKVGGHHDGDQPKFL